MGTSGAGTGTVVWGGNLGALDTLGDFEASPGTGTAFAFLPAAFI